MEYVQYEKFNRLCDLYFFMPGNPHKQKNDSENLYLIMTSMANSKPTVMSKNVSFFFYYIILFQKPLKISDEKKKTLDLVESFWIRLQSKFKKLGPTFRFFDRNFDNQISLKEFRVVCEEMDMRFSSEELKMVFNYLVNEGETTLGY